MQVFVSAGDSSSDIHCANLINELKKYTKDFMSVGLGGDHLQASGTELLMHNREFSVGGGPLEVIGKIPKRRRLEKKVEELLYNTKLTGAILVDNGEINLRLASLLNFFGVPVVYFIPPKVWAWRPGRLYTIYQHVKLVLGILPFEEEIYKQWEIPFQYVGNPLIDEVDYKMTRGQACQKLGISEENTYIALLLGSRFSEVKNHIEVFSGALEQFFKLLSADHLNSTTRPKILVPVASNIDLSSVEARLKEKFSDVVCFKGMSHECLRASRAALVKSGTSTLEAALLQTPMVLAYQVAKSSIWVYRNIVRYPGFIGLVNLFLADDADAALSGTGKSVVPECALEECKPERIAAELFEIYKDGSVREKMLLKLQKIESALSAPSGGSPIQNAARRTLDVFSGKAFNG